MSASESASETASETGFGDGFGDGCVDDGGGVEGCLSDVEKFQHRIHKE